MWRVGLTMRLDPTPQGEWRDALDAEWPRLLSGLGLSPVLLPNCAMPAVEAIETYALDAILLTGGNDVLDSGETYSKDRNDFEADLMRNAAGRKMPVVGVCRGMQMMNLYAGGTVKPVAGHVRVDHKVIWKGQSCIVNSYHGYGIDHLSPALEITAQAEDGNIEAVSHKILPWQAVMWHPERALADQAGHLAWLAAALEGEG